MWEPKRVRLSSSDRVWGGFTATTRPPFLTSNGETCPAAPAGIRTTVGSSVWTSYRAGASLRPEHTEPASPAQTQPANTAADPRGAWLKVTSKAPTLVGQKRETKPRLQLPQMQLRVKLSITWLPGQVTWPAPPSITNRNRCEYRNSSYYSFLKKLLLFSV